jgi:hypothetical protein
MLGGSGQAWLDDVQLDVVSDDVPTTGQPGGLYPAPAKSDTRDLDRRRRAQEVAYRHASGTPVNLALRREAGAVLVAASRNTP